MYVFGRHLGGPPGPGGPEEPDPEQVGVGVGRGWSGPDAFVIPNRQDCSVSPMELGYRQDSRFYRLNCTDIDENATL